MGCLSIAALPPQPPGESIWVPVPANPGNFPLKMAILVFWCLWCRGGGGALSQPTLTHPPLPVHSTPGVPSFEVCPQSHWLLVAVYLPATCWGPTWVRGADTILPVFDPAPTGREPPLRLGGAVLGSTARKPETVAEPSVTVKLKPAPAMMPELLAVKRRVRLPLSGARACPQPHPCQTTKHGTPFPPPPTSHTVTSPHLLTPAMS